MDAPPPPPPPSSHRRQHRRKGKRSASQDLVPPASKTPTRRHPSSQSPGTSPGESERVHRVTKEVTAMTLRRVSQKRVCDMVARPGVGDLGRKIQIYANVFGMAFRHLLVHQYDVDIQVAPPRGGRGRGRGGRRGRGRAPPPRPEGPVKLPADVIELIYRELTRNGHIFPPGASFDGNKILYVPQIKMDPIRNRIVNITVDDKRKSYTVSVMHTATVNLADLTAYMEEPGAEPVATAVAALDVALRHCPSLHPDIVRINNGLFRPDRSAPLISPGIQAWAGYIQTARPCQLGLTLNMNSCFAPMIKQQTVAEYMTEFVEKAVNRRLPTEAIHEELTDKMYGEMASKINKLKARTVHSKRKQIYPKLAGFTNGTARSTVIKDQRGQRINIVDYMRHSNNYRVEYPDLRLVSIYKGDKVSHVAFPPECLLIRGVPYKRQLSDFQKERLIKAATQKPNDKKRFIEACLQDQLKDPQNRDHIAAWQLDIEPEMKKIPARILPTPSLEGGNQEFIDVKGKGEWDVSAYKFTKAIAVKSWALVNFCHPAPLNPAILTFFQQLMDMMQRRGMEVPGKPFKLDEDRKKLYNASDILRYAAEKAGEKFGHRCQIILVIMPDFAAKEGNRTIKTEDLYKEIKVASDQLLGIPSQCILVTNAGLLDSADHNRPAYLAQLTLKINAKLGGVNSVLYTLPGDLPTCPFPKLGDRPFMVMGADLTHPSPSSEDKRSVVGVVASMDRSLSQYACRTLFQEEGLKTGREVIVDLKDTVKDLLKAFYQKNGGVKPEAILFYRDGVSQGEYPKVLENEYQAIRDACAEMGDPAAEYCPPISFIIVQKRHLMRFAPCSKADSDRSGNVLPGTVVDTHVCHPHGFDFYLNSHSGIQGTSRPTLYSVLVDEVGFEPNELQLLTYWMCHLFCRCTKSVSYCPPAYYAHHAAARGKILLMNRSQAAKTVVHEAVKDRLFFI